MSQKKGIIIAIEMGRLKGGKVERSNRKQHWHFGAIGVKENILNYLFAKLKWKLVKRGGLKNLL